MSFPLEILSVPKAPAIRRVQVYGERCSGTNLLITLIERNLTSAVFTEAFGFKHWFVPEALALPEDTLGLLIARNAESWLQSLHEKAWHHPEEIAALPFSAYLRHEWRCVWDDHWLGVGPGHPQYGSEMMQERCPRSGRRLADPLALRQEKARNWRALGARSPAFACLRQEDLVADQDGFLEALSRFGIERGPFTPITRYKGERGGRPYRPKKRPPLTPADARYLRRRADETVQRARCSKERQV